MTTFTTAVVQMRADQGLAGNLEAAGHWISEAVARGAQLIALPENFAYYGKRPSFERVAAEATSSGPARAFLADQARRHGVWLLGGTVPIPDGGVDKPYASSLLLSPAGEEVARYDKIHLFDVDVEESGKSYRESDDYLCGAKVVTADLPEFRLGLSVCYDLRFPELYRTQVGRGARVLSAPSAFTAATGKAHWSLLVRARAVENLSFMLAPNLADRDHPSRPTWGGSAIVDPWGRVLAEMENEEGVAVADLDLAAQDRIRRQMPALNHRRLVTL